MIGREVLGWKTSCGLVQRFFRLTLDYAMGPILMSFVPFQLLGL